MRVGAVRSGLGAFLATALLASGFDSIPAFAGAGEPYQPMALPSVRPVPGTAVPVLPRLPDPAADRALRGDRAVAWPAAGVAALTLGPAAAKAGTLPLSIRSTVPAAGGAARVRVEMLDRAASGRAGVSGPVWRLGRADGVALSGPASIALDYSGFRNAYGGDWAHRLRLVRLPECALTAPGSAACRPSALPSRNDVRAGMLTADVSIPAEAGGGLFAAVADTAGPTGSFAATSLSPSATWSGGNPTGDFAWTYPMSVPPGLGGPAPQLALGYSSSSVDGRNSATNNQPSQIGEGFEFHPGYVERRYKRCADDLTGSNTTTKTGDQCWGTDNATLSLNGRGGELVRDDASGTWKVKNDDGSRVERLTGAANGDGGTGGIDGVGEYWKVTTSDGTQYFFGLTRLPGWTAGKAETNSTWTVPVFGNQAGEPCFQAGNFAGSWCRQAYRWQLDYVVDTHGNVMSYWYQRELNRYALNLKPDQPQEYVRGGWLDRVDYGQRDGQVYSTTAVGRVTFEMAERCLPGSTCDQARPENFPDTPLDQKCTAAPCTEKWSPSFWSTKRIARIVTRVWTGTGTTFRDVDSWTLRHTYPEPGDGTRAGLWLAGITRTGHVGGTESLPELTFSGIQLSNRALMAVDSNAPMNWWRISVVNNETGGAIAVTYSPPECDRVDGPMPSTEDSNTLRCMPVKVPRPGSDTAVDTDWFHKYVVTEVNQVDRTGGNPPVVTRYEYLGGAAWRHEDNDGLVDAKYKTWSQWRGYARVRTTVGGAHDTPRVSEVRYFRGMNGDKLAGGGTRSVSVPASTGDSLPDHDEFAGTPRESTSYLAAGGAMVTTTITDPWRSGPTATRVRPWGTVEARRVDQARMRSVSPLAGGGTRTAEVRRSFDSSGALTQVDDLGDVSTTVDDTCVRHTYSRNTSLWILDLPSRTETVGVACATTPSRPGDVLADVRNYYDGAAAHGTAPTSGDLTRVEQLDKYSAGQPVYVTVGRTVVDTYGRGVESYDAKGEKTTTAYTPATGGPVTRVTTTNPLGFVSTMDIEPAWGAGLVSTDANNRRSELAYDPLGRTVKGWDTTRSRSAGDSPSSQFSYLVRTDGPVVTVTQALLPNGGYLSTYELFDGLLRPRQTQLPAPGGGRVLSDTLYDSRGLAFKRNAAYFHTAAPGTAIHHVIDAAVPGQNLTVFDGAGRATVEALRSFGVEKWRTTTSYEGERVHVLPPRGTAATSIKDVRGRTVELIQYRGSAVSGPTDVTRYAYDRAGRLTAVTDPAGSVWRYAFDLRGRMVRTEDPDRGTTELTYNDAGEVVSTKDGRGVVLAFEYDRLGRPVRTRDGSVTGTIRAEVVYDTLAKGYPTGSMRFHNGARYDTRVLGYDVAYRPTGTRVTLPLAEGGLAGSYDFGYTYLPNGAPATVTMPATGGLSAETVRTLYDDEVGLPQQTQSVLDGALRSYVQATTYTKFSEVEQLRHDPDGSTGTAGKVAWRSFVYDDVTRRLAGSVVEKETGPVNRVSDVAYTYDIGGLVRKVADRADGGGDVQCFDHDHRNRLTEAWTPTSGDCAAPRSTSALGGPAPYWTSWTYSTVGNRLSEVSHRGTGDVSKSFAYPEPNQPRPHTVRSMTIVDTAGTRTLNYGYDTSGNTTSRVGPNGTVQTLSWDTEGQLGSVVEGGDTTGFVYDAGGNRLLRKDARGTTLFLGTMEVRLDRVTGAKSATRYYAQGGAVVAVRTTAGLSWLCSDHHGTATVTIDATSQAVQRRRFTPFGEARGTGPASWPDNKGFVGGEQDPTGLTQLGARLYDPAIGRFISADPLTDISDPQQLQGYSYANNSPVSASDASGLMIMTDEHWYGGKGASATPKVGQNTPPVAQTGPPPGPPADEVRRANEIKKKSKLDIVLEAGGQILLEVLGINDIRNCVTKGDVMACVSTVANIIPWGKIFKLPKIVKAFKRAYDAVTAFGEKLKWANRILKQADEAAEAAAAATAKAADDAAATAAKSADDAAGAGARRADEASEAAADSCRTNSFVPGTLVLLADGTARPIEQIEVGDQVLATDPETGETKGRAVATSITGTGSKTLVRITVEADGVKSSLTATDGHPFWLPEQGVWLESSQLRPGDRLVTPDGARVTVLAVTAYRQLATVHNLTVTSAHTYYAIAGETPVLVHNCGGKLTVHKYAPEAEGDVPHFSVEVSDGRGNVLHTEQIITSMDHSTTTIARQSSSLQLVQSVTLDLPNPQAAMDLQGSLIGRQTGPYNLLTNSCFSHCMNVAREGGIASSGVRDFASKLGWSVQDLLR